MGFDIPTAKFITNHQKLMEHSVAVKKNKKKKKMIFMFALHKYVVISSTERH